MLVSIDNGAGELGGGRSGKKSAGGCANGACAAIHGTAAHITGDSRADGSGGGGGGSQPSAGSGGHTPAASADVLGFLVNPKPTLHTAAAPAGSPGSPACALAAALGWHVGAAPLTPMPM